MKLLLVIVLFVCLIFTFANGTRMRVEKHWKPITVPKGWSVISTNPELDHKLTLTFVLKIRNQEHLEKQFWDISNPDSPNYAHYMDLEDIIEHYAPEPTTLKVLYKWLSSFGIDSYKTTPTRDFVTVQTTLEIAQKMFQVKYIQFSHPEHGTVTRSLEAYTLPEEVADIVSFVTGTNRFPSRGTISVTRPSPSKKRSLSQSSVTPEVIWSTFNTNGIKGNSSKNLQAVIQFLQQYYDPTDLSDFQTHFNLDSQPAAKILGPNDPTNPGTEALLDIEYIIATAPKIPSWFWSNAGEYNGQEPFVQWAEDLNAATEIPWVASVSYGDEESSVSKDYTDRLNIELQKMGSRGVTVLFAAGDNGVGCTSSCVNDPNWPASSPYVTTVGGFVNQSPLTGDSISSGGFSNYYSTAPYQVDVVKNYLSTGPNLPPASQYNASGRAMPDVSSFSENVQVFQDGEEMPVGGTSCASPVFAGIVSLINDDLLQSNLNTVGFLNTALYKIGTSNPDAFIDITSGNNGNGCCNGFTATTGWDPITGWGGPNYPVLKQALMDFQQKNKLK